MPLIIFLVELDSRKSGELNAPCVILSAGVLVRVCKWIHVLRLNSRVCDGMDIMFAVAGDLLLV